MIIYTLPERLRGPEPADCEVVLGDDYTARVLECVLRPESWWLWWTESTLLRRLERHAATVHRLRRLPEVAPDDRTADGDPVWIARGILRAFGAALLPPASPLQARVLDAGASLYSEMDANFWIGVSPRSQGSPRAIEAWCKAAIPSSLRLDPFQQGAERLCMVHDGDLSIAVPARDAPSVLRALEQWASARGVALELSGAA